MKILAYSARERVGKKSFKFILINMSSMSLKKQGFINIWIIDENFTFNLARAKRILTLLIEQKVT